MFNFLQLFGAYTVIMERDQELNIIKKVVDGDIEAFGFIIRKYQCPLYNLISKMTHSATATEELLQIVFIKAFEKLPAFKPEFRFFSWIYRIAINETINYLKSVKRFSTLTDQVLTQTADIVDEDENLISAENLQLIVSQLKDDYKTLIILKYYQSLTYEEICQITGLEIIAVRSKLYMAREILRKMIIKNSIND